MFLCSVGGCADCTAAARRNQPSGLGGDSEETMRALQVATDHYNIIHNDDSVSVPTPPPTTCGTLGQLESTSVSTQSQLASTFISLFQVGCFFKETSWLFLQRDRDSFQVGCFFKETDFKLAVSSKRQRELFQWLFKKNYFFAVFGSDLGSELKSHNQLFE